MTISFKQFDKEAKAEVDAAVEEAKASQFPESVDVFTDVYQKGYEPPYLRGREREEVRCFLVTYASGQKVLTAIFSRFITIRFLDSGYWILYF